jgi:thioredoxin reductase
VVRVGGSERVLAARGHAWVSGLDLESDGTRRRVKCDLVAVAALPAPASEVPRLHGARVELRPEAGGFACIVDAAGRTSIENVHACGDVCGYRGPEAALAHGAEVGAAVASF